MRPVDDRLFFAYARVSTEEQADTRNGLEAQHTAIDAEANRRGWAVEHYADEGASGKYINSKLREVLQLLASGQGDGLVVAKLDRLARSVVHAANIIQDAHRGRRSPAGRPVPRHPRRSAASVFARSARSSAGTAPTPGRTCRRGGCRTGRVDGSRCGPTHLASGCRLPSTAVVLPRPSDPPFRLLRRLVEIVSPGVHHCVGVAAQRIICDLQPQTFNFSRAPPYERSVSADLLCKKNPLVGFKLVTERLHTLLHAKEGHSFIKWPAEL